MQGFNIDKEQNLSYENSWCLDNPQDVKLSGNFRYGSARQLQVNFDKVDCQDCKEEEWDQAYGQFIDSIMVEIFTNTQQYNPNEYNGPYITKTITKLNNNLSRDQPLHLVYETTKNIV